jgi:hypothetical protein
MYLVELRPGKEELYRSSDELALAIRNGDVDARSRVYHRATAKWISITLHPQYKAIVAAAKDDSVARSTRRGWGILGGGPSDQVMQTSQVDPATSGANLLHRWRRPLAFGLSGLLLISGIQLAFSGPRPPWAGRTRTAAVARANKTETTRKAEPSQSAARAEQVQVPSSLSLVSLASSKTSWEEEPLVGDTITTASLNDTTASLNDTTASLNQKIRPVLPRAPRLRSKSLREALAPGDAEKLDGNSLDALFARYGAAHDSAQSRLETGLRVARLTRLFDASRLSPNGGVTDTRMSLAGAANFIRVYRQQQAVIEKAYQDTVTAMARRQSWSPKKVREWYSRAPRKEAPTLELLGGSLLASIDSLLGVLNAQAGAYKIRGTAIAFEDPTAGQTYGALRRRISEQIDAAIAAGGATSPGAAGLLLQAIGTTALPRET